MNNLEKIQHEIEKQLQPKSGGEIVPLPRPNRFQSLDDTLRLIREDHEEEMRAMREALSAAENDAALAKTQLAVAVEERAKAERIAIKFITQFALVEKVFSEVKALALEIEGSKDGESIKG